MNRDAETRSDHMAGPIAALHHVPESKVIGSLTLSGVSKAFAGRKAVFEGLCNCRSASLAASVFKRHSTLLSSKFLANDESWNQTLPSNHVEIRKGTHLNCYPRGELP